MQTAGACFRNSNNGLSKTVSILEYMAISMVQPPWLSIEPESGVIPPNGEIGVDVVFNADGMYGGEYEANIIFIS